MEINVPIPLPFRSQPNRANHYMVSVQKWKRFLQTKYVMFIFIILLIVIYTLMYRSQNFISHLGWYTRMVTNSSTYYQHAEEEIIKSRCPCNQYFAFDNIDTAIYALKQMQKKEDGIKTLISAIEQDHPALPAKFLINRELRGDKCSSSPRLFTIKHQNMIWQEAQINSAKYHLYSAHLDRRSVKDGPLIRILAMADSIWPSIPYCSIFTTGISPIGSKAIHMEYIHWAKPVPNQWQPYIITCRGTDENGVIANVVSITESLCSSNPTNALTVIDGDPVWKKKDLAICTKFLYGKSYDFSIRLVEWIETNLELGVENITFYVHSVHPNVSKVLDYYEQTGVVQVLPWTNPAYFPNIPSMQQLFFDTQRYPMFTVENIPYTDCLLRHINTHRFVGVWEIDEVFTPVSGSSIMSVIIEARKKLRMQGRPPITAYLARGTYFFTNLTDYSAINNYTTPHSRPSWTDKLRILTHTARSLEYTPILNQTKSVYDTSLVLGMHAHYPLSNIHGPVDRQRDLYSLYPDSEAFLGHYRHTSQGGMPSRDAKFYRRNITEDRTVLRNGERIFRNVNNVLDKLNML